MAHVRGPETAGRRPRVTRAEAPGAGHNPALYTHWCGALCARAHTLGSKLEGVAMDHLLNEITFISCRGREGTGKTALALNIAHILHKKFEAMVADRKLRDRDEYTRRHLAQMSVGYIVRLLDAENLRELAEQIRQCPRQNRIFIFDDLSHLGGLRPVKRMVSQIRHAENGDWKTVVIYNFHSSKAFDKYLRDTPFIFQTSMTIEEVEYVQDNFGGTKQTKQAVSSFKTLYSRLRRKGQVTMNMSPGSPRPQYVKYLYSRPFRLGLYYDSDRLSFFVWPDTEACGTEDCAVCPHHPDVERRKRGGSAGGSSSSGGGGYKLDVAKFCAWFEAAFGRKGGGRAMSRMAHEALRRSPPGEDCIVPTAVLRELSRGGALPDPAAVLNHWYGTDAFSRPPAARRIPREVLAAFEAEFGLTALRPKDQRYKGTVRRQAAGELEVLPQ